MEKIKPKIFKCECGYHGIRWNDNDYCRKCGKRGKLEEMMFKEI